MSNLPSQETLRDFAESLPLANPWGPRSVPRWISRNASTNVKAVLRIVFYLDETYIDNYIDCPQNGRHILRAVTGRGSRFGSIEDCMGRNPFPCGCRRPPSLPKITRDLAQQCFDIWHRRFKDTENRIREYFKPEIARATRGKDIHTANTLRAQKNEALKKMRLPSSEPGHRVTTRTTSTAANCSAPSRNTEEQRPVEEDAAIVAFRRRISRYRYQPAENDQQNHLVEDNSCGSKNASSVQGPSLLRALDALDSRLSNQQAAGPSTPTNARAAQRKPAPFPMPLPTPPDSSPVKPPTPKSFHLRGDTVDSPIEISDDDTNQDLGSGSSTSRKRASSPIDQFEEVGPSSRSAGIRADGKKRRRVMSIADERKY
ncbi:hypothetical protein VNI00_016405 [Paramarasmius palmivorus]|uniref:Uncharacterized protein n=1 Tax=Paramarasmius palmivorus TaxID=297713 RepID=A0AAW0BE83_9AGAR